MISPLKSCSHILGVRKKHYTTFWAQMQNIYQDLQSKIMKIWNTDKRLVEKWQYLSTLNHNPNSGIYKNGFNAFYVDRNWFAGRMSIETSLVSHFSEHEAKQASCFVKQKKDVKWNTICRSISYIEAWDKHNFRFTRYIRT
jgi:hypothetical protein